MRRSKSIVSSPHSIDSVLGRLAAHPRAPQRRFDAAAELAHREGLGDVVVGADLEPGDLVGLAAFRGQHDDRHLAARAQLAADFDPVEAGQHQVEDDEVEAALFEALQGFAAVEGGGDVVAVLAQGIAEQRLNRLLVVDEENAGRPVSHGLKGSDAVDVGRMCEYPELRIWTVGADNEEAMQTTGTESLVESGHYKPDPSQIATAMLQPPRRPRAADRRHVDGRAGRSPPAPAVRPPGSLISTPVPGATSPIAVSVRFRRFARSASAPRRGAPAAAPPAARSPRRRRRPARSGSRPAAAATSATPRRQRQRGRRRSAGATPLAAARWPASPPRPSLRSIIARGARRGEGPAGGEARRRVELARRAAARRSSAGTASAPAPGRSSSSRPAAAPPSSPVRTSASPGRAPPRVTSCSGARRVADDGDRQGQGRGAGDVAAGQGRAGLGGQRRASRRPARGSPSSPRSAGAPRTT